MPFEVKHEIFSGPLDLLLGLIEKRKLFVNDISLSQVTDDFLSHVKNFDQFPVEDVSDFVVIASTLILIKSRSLLPELSLTEEEEESIEDLEGRLKEYQKYKQLSAHIQKLFNKQPLFSKLYIPSNKKIKVFAPSKDATLQNLAEAITRVINSIPQKQVLPKVEVKKTKSLEDVIQDLTTRMSQALSMSFQKFSSMTAGTSGKSGGAGANAPKSKEEFKHEKVTVIVSFLAMLELVKQGVIAAKQDADFGDIMMESGNIGVPRY